MSETLTFHFEGNLTDSHQMNFYEAARFQYAAARLLVKLGQFRINGRFVQKITNRSNVDIRLVSQNKGSFNLNVEVADESVGADRFVNVPISDLVAYVSERVIEKIDEEALTGFISGRGGLATIRDLASDKGAVAVFDQLIAETMADRALTANLPKQLLDLIKRRISEAHREQKLADVEREISKIDFARSQKLIAMSAPLISEMATALRRSATSLEVSSHAVGESRPFLFLDQAMAYAIETALVDQDVTPILGNINQFNKDNGWGKIKIENGTRTVSFSIPYDRLPAMRQTIIDTMKQDMVYLQTYFVRDRSGEIVRLIAVGVLPTPVD